MEKRIAESGLTCKENYKIVTHLVHMRTRFACARGARGGDRGVDWTLRSDANAAGLRTFPGRCVEGGRGVAGPPEIECRLSCDPW